MNYELCPNCREPLQGLVCRCGTDLREVDIVYCHDCDKPAVRSDCEKQPRDTGHPMHRTKHVVVCRHCQ